MWSMSWKEYLMQKSAITDNVWMLWVNKKSAPSSQICYCPLQIAYALDSTYFESLFEFSFVHLVLDTFFTFFFVCHPLLLCLFLACLACLFHWVCHSIFHLMLSDSSIWAFLAFLLCYSYVEECECSWLIWLETHYFGSPCRWSLFLKVELWVIPLGGSKQSRGIMEWARTWEHQNGRYLWEQVGPRAWEKHHTSFILCYFCFEVTYFLLYF